jgi:RNA polymerase sigma factor (sigma-70 family)
LKKKKLLFESIENSPEIYKIESDEQFSSDHETEIGLQINKVKNSLNLMPDGYRIVLSLYLFEGYDHEEISQILKITESTARSQLTRAKQKLIDILNNKL